MLTCLADQGRLLLSVLMLVILAKYNVCSVKTLQGTRLWLIPLIKGETYLLK